MISTCENTVRELKEYFKDARKNPLCVALIKKFKEEKINIDSLTDDQITGFLILMVLAMNMEAVES